MAMTFSPERIGQLERAYAEAGEALAEMKKGIGCYDVLVEQSDIPALTKIGNAQAEGFAALSKSYEEFMQSIEDALKEYKNTAEVMGY